MIRFDHPMEKLIKTIIYHGVQFEIVERPDVLWVGSVDYANNNTDEPDWGITLKRFQDIRENMDNNKESFCCWLLITMRIQKMIF